MALRAVPVWQAVGTDPAALPFWRSARLRRVGVSVARLLELSPHEISHRHAILGRNPPDLTSK